MDTFEILLTMILTILVILFLIIGSTSRSLVELSQTVKKIAEKLECDNSNIDFKKSKMEKDA